MAKRRKVWVNEWAADEDGQAGLGDLAWKTKAAALLGIASDGKAVRFIERLPGDVVLSANWLLSKALVTDFESADDRARTLALLRGRR